MGISNLIYLQGEALNPSLKENKKETDIDISQIDKTFFQANCPMCSQRGNDDILQCKYLLSLVYECQNNQSVQPFDDYFTPLYSVQNYNTRQAFKGDIYVPGINTTQYGKIC